MGILRKRAFITVSFLLLSISILMALTMIDMGSDADISRFCLSSYDQEFHEMETYARDFEDAINSPVSGFTDLQSFLTRYGRSGGPTFDIAGASLAFRTSYMDTDGTVKYRYNIILMRGNSERPYVADVYSDGKIRVVMKGL